MTASILATRAELSSAFIGSPGGNRQIAVHGMMVCGWRTGALRRRRAIERTMHATCVVIVFEFSQLPSEVGDVPEERAVEKLTPDGAD